MKTSTRFIESTPSGKSIRSLCRSNARSKRYDTATGAIEYRFEDGSGIVMQTNDSYEECVKVLHFVPEFV